jgi:hypothetical protein
VKSAALIVVAALVSGGAFLLGWYIFSTFLPQEMPGVARYTISVILVTGWLEMADSILGTALKPKKEKP